MPKSRTDGCTSAIGLVALLLGAIPAAARGEVGEDGRTYVPSQNIREVSSRSAAGVGSLDVALLAAAGGDVGSPFYTDTRDRLLASGEFASVTVINVGEVTPLLSELETFDAVLVWSNFAFADAAALGENLSRYVDGGGGAVIAVFANSSATAGRALSGRWATNDYEIIPAGSGHNSGLNFQSPVAGQW